MATRPASTKKAAPAKKAVAKGPAPAAPKPKAVAVPVVTLRAVFEQLGEAQALPKKQVHDLLADFVAAITTNLEAGARIRGERPRHAGSENAGRANGPQSRNG
jgi:hypothetical protein